MDALREWSGRETLPLTEGIAGMVGFLPFSDSLWPCVGGAPPTAADILLGSDAFGLEAEGLVAEGNEVRPEEAKFDPVARFVAGALVANEEEGFDRPVAGCWDVEVIRDDGDDRQSKKRIRG